MKSGGIIKRIVIAGPTGIGKTSISLELVKLIREKHGDASIISADSRQCYRLLDIGTGKILPEQSGDIKHYNISTLNPDQKDTAADFASRARVWENEIISRNEIPLVVGGSTLHLQSLIWPLDDIPGACVYNQLKLGEQEKEHGTDFILQKLRKADPAYVNKMDGYNRNRVFRALDVYMQTGRPFSSYHSDQNLNIVPDDTHLVVLTCKRDVLVSGIETRVDKMIDDGLVNETRSILGQGYDESLQALQTVGYKEAIQFIKGELNQSEMSNAIKTSTRQYAKRQATWFRRWKSAVFLDITELEPAEAAKQILISY